MNKVKVHPHKNLVNSGIEACVSITPDKKHGRAYYMGTVALRDVTFRIHESGVKRAQAENVRNVHAWAVGEVIWELPEQYPLDANVADSMIQVTYHFDYGRFIAADGTDVTDGNYKAAYFCGRDFYITKEW